MTGGFLGHMNFFTLNTKLLLSNKQLGVMHSQQVHDCCSWERGVQYS